MATTVTEEAGIVLPGDNVSVPQDTKVLKLGPGLILGSHGDSLFKFSRGGCVSSSPHHTDKESSSSQTDQIQAVRTGKVIIRGGSSSGTAGLYIESSTRRYIPSANDLVLGIVHSKVSTGSDTGGYRVDLANRQLASTLGQINHHHNNQDKDDIEIGQVPPIQANFSCPTYLESTAILDGLAFTNAHKKNRPLLSPGSIVYGRILPSPITTGHQQLDKYSDINITCQETNTKNLIGLGPLPATGYIIDVGISVTRRLLTTPKDMDNNILMILGSQFSFEIIVGANGRVWINAHEENRKNKPIHRDDDDDGAMDLDQDDDDDDSSQSKQSISTVLIVSQIIQQSPSLITKEQITNRMNQLIKLYSS